MKKVLLFLFMAVGILTAGAQKKKELTTLVNVNYCLPKVSYQIEVTMECTRFIPGPYSKFAEKELGVKPEITQAGVHWYIKDIDIKPSYIPDEKAVYAISAANEYTPVTLSLSPDGFLTGVAGGDGQESCTGMEGFRFSEKVPGKEEKIDIMKLNTHNHLKEVLDTNYTYQEIDGEVKRIWDPIVRYVPKTESDNVKEAVSEIFRIRSERVKLLAAENNVPDGKSLEIILKEFDRMEANYLSLFMGKTEKREVKKVVTCIPVKEDEPIVAFRFSETEGLVDVKNVSAVVYSLNIADVVVPASKPMSGEGNGQAIYYRVPAVGELQLLKGKEKIMGQQTIVPQLGEIKRFPVDVISNEGLMLEFYPRFGALKSVKKK
ncbi:MAG: DUF4831 family protein [Odoribacter sp.]|nr:DUF4831 family protein [Odoribacter sp.]